VNRGDLVHTPDGWAEVQGRDDLLTDDATTGEILVVRGVNARLLHSNGSYRESGGRWYRLSEVELYLEAATSHA